MIPRLRLLPLLLVIGFISLIQPGTARAVDVKRVVGTSGVEAWLVEDHANPIVALRFAFRGGAALDPAGREGLADMVSSLLDEGAGELGAQEFQTRLEDLAVEMGFDSGYDSFGGNLKTLTEHTDNAFGLLRLALTAPRFDPDAVERMRSQLLANIRRTSERPGSVASDAMLKAFFPDHPYGRRSEGTLDSVAAITSDDLRTFVHQRFARDNLVIGVVGDMTPETLAKALDATFGDLPEHAASWDITETEPKTDGGTVVIVKDVPQSVILFGQKGLKRDDPDFYTAVVLNHILGGGTFTSRLFGEIREKRGLAYSIDSYLNPMDHTALWLGNAGTANERAAETIKLVRDVWRTTAENGVAEDELQDAKTYLTGSFPLRFNSSARIAGILVAMQMGNLGIDYLDRRNGLVEAVTLDAVNALAKKLLDPDRLTFIVVGKPEGLAATDSGRPPSNESRRSL